MREQPTGPVLLTVDDEEDMRFLMQLYLKPAGYDVRPAKDGLEAMVVLDDCAVDLVLLDLRMPRLDGWGVLERMRAEPALADIPVIVLSAHASEQTAQRAIAAGATSFMNKPFSRSGLLAALAEHLGDGGPK